jgi:hypothetical protein
MTVDNKQDLRNGLVICGIRRRPIYGGGFRALPGTSKQAAYWVQDNVDCALYAGRDTSSEKARLKRALRAMSK